MTQLFSRLAVLGLGLLGGSVAAAARERGVVGTVVGSARRRGPLEQALADGIVDEIADVERAVRGADLVILATPVSSMAGVLDQARESLAPDVLVTDVGSVKAALADTLPAMLPAGACFVGSHPMAGSHEIGVEHARADLLAGAVCVVTPRAGNSEEAAAAERLGAFWTALGAHVAVRSPVGHDEEVAWVSHLPHVLAFAYARSLEEAPRGSGELAGSGFRDFVRIARSDAALWSDILNLNRKALARPLQELGAALSELGQALEAGDVPEQQRILTAARAALDALAPGPADGQTLRPAGRQASPVCETASEECSARSGGEIPEIQAAPRAAATRSNNPTHE